MNFTAHSFKKPRPLRRPSERKSLKKVGVKGEFWLFVSQILNRFFLAIDQPQRCEKCDGTAQCGRITPAHSRRRQDIRRGDFYYALRVAVLGQQCHFDIDSLGRRAAEPLIEEIIQNRFKKLGLSEQNVKDLLMKIAAEIQAEHPATTDDEGNEIPGKYDQFLVEL